MLLGNFNKQGFSASTRYDELGLILVKDSKLWQLLERLLKCVSDLFHCCVIEVIIFDQFFSGEEK